MALSWETREVRETTRSKEVEVVREKRNVDAQIDAKGFMRVRRMLAVVSGRRWIGK